MFEKSVDLDNSAIAQLMLRHQMNNPVLQLFA
jgi:hypothetical protein